MRQGQTKWIGRIEVKGLTKAEDWFAQKYPFLFGKESFFVDRSYIVSKLFDAVPGSIIVYLIIF